MFDWIQNIIDWILGLFNTVTKLDHFVTNPSEQFGYGLSNDLLQLPLSEVSKMAEAMAVNGVPVTHIEVLSFGEMGYYTNSDEAIDRLIPRTKEFLKRRITVWMTVVNWNYKTICELQFDLAWYAHIVNRIKDELGTDGIVLESCSEWGPKCRNANCWKKAEQFHNWTNDNWPD